MVEFTTPVGRIVWGQEPLKQKPVLDDNKVPKVGANGQPRQQISFGLAIPKDQFQAQVWPHLYGIAAQAFNGSPPPNFAYKYVDGDGIDKNGVPYNNRPGYAGCYVLNISTEAYVPPLFKLNETGLGYRQMAPQELKCGDWVAVGVEVAYNGQKSPKIPGVYINPKAVEFVAYDQHIAGQGGADPQAMFGGQRHALPPGASATPIGGAGAVTMPGMGGGQPGMMQPAMGGMPGMQPQMQPQPTAQPQPGMMTPPQGMQQPQMQPAMGGMPGQPQPGMMMQPQGMQQPQPGMMPAPAPEFLQPGMPPQPQMMAPPQGMPGQPRPGMMMPGMMPPR